MDDQYISQLREADELMAAAKHLDRAITHAKDAGADNSYIATLEDVRDNLQHDSKSAWQIVSHGLDIDIRKP